MASINIGAKQEGEGMKVEHLLNWLDTPIDAKWLPIIALFGIIITVALSAGQGKSDRDYD